MYYKLILLNLILVSAAVSAMEESKSKPEVFLEEMTGAQARRYHKQLAENSIQNFAEFPYLYKGSVSDERKFLNKYYHSADAKFVVVFDALQRVVGFSISNPLKDEGVELQAPYQVAGRDPNRYLYLVEICISPEQRHGGVFRKMLQAHQRHARLKGFDYGAFAIIERPGESVRVSEIAKSRFGGSRVEGGQVQWPWKSTVTGKEELNTLSIWEKAL